MSITEKQLTDIQARLDAATHEFLPVNGHPDDDECTNRADGTDDTYCGEPEAAHDVISDEFSRDLADLLAEVHRLRGQLADAWDEGYEAGTDDADSIYWSAVEYRFTNPYRKEDND